MPKQAFHVLVAADAVGSHDPIHAAFPFRYKRFIKSGSAAHTMLGNSTLFYTSTVNGVPIYQWVDSFANAQPGWIDLVEDFVPLP